jgi:hypothetical protein
MSSIIVRELGRFFWAQLAKVGYSVLTFPVLCKKIALDTVPAFGISAWAVIARRVRPLIVGVIGMSSRRRRLAKRRSVERARSRKKFPRLPRCPLCSKYHSAGFRDGVASIMDMLGILAPTKDDIRNAYGYAHGADEADLRAIANDWLHVGQDLYEVLSDRERREEAANQASH